ncbi:hypothetical protein [Modestobacter sp. NPDC049651]|uniref:hypothetical protein n=1 Tax=unclassified Modestobacter TaxID=2643866 RepID=UPI0033FA1699
MTTWGNAVDSDLDLDHAWHPVARSADLVEGGWVQVRLLGRTWTVQRSGGAPGAEPPAWGVDEQHGLVWLAPAEPHGPRLEVPEAHDPRFAAAWLPPVRSGAPAAALADALRTGPAEEPGRRVTTVVQEPFQLRRRVEDPVTGTVRTLHVVLQPEDDDSTNVHARLLLRTEVPPTADDVAAEVAAAREQLAATLALPAPPAPNTVAPLAAPVPA